MLFSARPELLFVVVKKMANPDQSIDFYDPHDWRRFVEYLHRTNRFVLTGYWQNFLHVLVETAKQRIMALDLGTRPQRARIGTSWEEHEFADEWPSPISPAEDGCTSTDYPLQFAHNLAL